MMKDKIAGYLEVGIDPVTHEIIINFPKTEVNAKGEWHVVFSENQARNLGEILLDKAYEAETERLNAMPPVIHAMSHGIPLCGFTVRKPMYWPKGHLWVSLREPEDITCADCWRRVQDRNTGRA
jgi:hypothetical protein